MEISIARSHLETQGIFFSNISRTIGWESAKKLPCNVAAQSSRHVFHKLASSCHAFTAVYPRTCICRANSMPISLQESASYGGNSLEDENPSIDSKEETLAQPLTREQIMALLADTQREKLTKKLSEANQQNRFLKRQLHVKEDDLVKFKSELAAAELEIQALVRLAEEIAQCGIPEGSRKIKGKYIHSHLIARLEAVREQLKEQIDDVEAAQSKEVSVFWIGMAEVNTFKIRLLNVQRSVQVMGTFDGWSQGEHLSPEYTGSYTRFSTTLMLRPGRYEIKFLVDGEWQLSPQFPIVGEGLMENNLLKNKNKGNNEDQKTRSNRFLVTINIMGSAGPLRFVVNEKELVSGVIDTVLKSYAREGRLPLLGFDPTNFLLYSANAGFDDALSPLEPIGSFGARNFVLCKKQVYSSNTGPQSELVSQKSSGGWKA
ncbi:Protein PTST, chloroplastic, partial [Mucuna pruriens]